MSKVKAPLQINREKFLSSKSVMVSVEGTMLEAKPRQFSTGSLGYYANGKALVIGPDGQPLQLQIGCTITVCGTKLVKGE